MVEEGINTPVKLHLTGNSDLKKKLVAKRSLGYSKTFLSVTFSSQINILDDISHQKYAI